MVSKLYDLGIRLDQMEEALGAMQEEIRAMRKVILSISKRLGLLIKLQEEAAMKEMASESALMTEADLDGDGDNSDLIVTAEEETDQLSSVLSCVDPIRLVSIAR